MRINFDGTRSALSYTELLEQAGNLCSSDLLNEFLNISHLHAHYPNVKNSQENYITNSHQSGKCQFYNTKNIANTNENILISNKNIANESNHDANDECIQLINSRRHLPLYLPADPSSIRKLCRVVATNVKNLTHLKLATQFGARCDNLREHFMPEQYELMVSTQGHCMQVTTVLYDHTGQLIFTGCEDWLVKVWSADSGQLVQTFRGHKSQITGLCIDPSNTLLASCTEEQECGGIIRIWSLDSMSPVASTDTLRSTKKKDVLFFDWTNSVRMPLLVAVWNVEVRMWALEEGHERRRNNIVHKKTLTPEGESKCACLSPGGTKLIIGSKEGFVTVWNLISFVHEQTLLHQAPSNTTHTKISNVVWSHNDNKFLSSGEDGTVKIWHFSGRETGWIVWKTITLHLKNKSGRLQINYTIWSLDDRYIVCALGKPQQGSYLKVLDVNSGRVCYNLLQHTKCIHVLNEHPKIPHLFLSAGIDGLTIIWDLRTGQSAKVFQNSNYDNDEICAFSDGCFSCDGSSFVVSDILGNISLYGFGPREAYSSTCREQFFLTDYAPTILDSDRHILDQTYFVEPHLLPRGIYCSQVGYPHDTNNCPPSLDLSYVKRRFPILEISEKHKKIEKAEIDFLSVSPELSKSSLSSSTRKVRATPTNEVQFTGPRELRRQLDPGQARSLRPLVPLRGLMTEDVLLPGELEAGTREGRAAMLSMPGNVQEDDDEFEADQEEEDEDFITSEEEDFLSSSAEELVYSSSEGNYDVSGLRSNTYSMSTRLRANSNVAEPSSRQSTDLNHSGYPFWVKQTKPSSVYIPQIGDQVVFFRAGYGQFCQSFSQLSDQVPQVIPEICYCIVESIEYKTLPIQHCIINLNTIAPQSAIPQLKSHARNVATVENTNDVSQPSPTEDPPVDPIIINVDSDDNANSVAIRPFQSVAVNPIPGGLQVLQKHRFLFTVKYHHSSKTPDFLALASRFNQSLEYVWSPGMPFRAWLFNSRQTRGSWYSGVVVSVLMSSPWEALFVEWDTKDGVTVNNDGGGQRMSPWEVEPLDEENVSTKRHTWIETLDPSISQAIFNKFEVVRTFSEPSMFLQPVSLNDFPNYLDIIAFPINLTTINSRLRNMYYRSIAQLRFEVDMILNNARLLEDQSGQLVNQATLLVTKLKSVLESYTSDSAVMIPLNPEFKTKKKSTEFTSLLLPLEDSDSEDDDDDDDDHSVDDDDDSIDDWDEPTPNRSKRRTRSSFGSSTSYRRVTRNTAQMAGFSEDTPRQQYSSPVMSTRSRAQGAKSRINDDELSDTEYRTRFSARRSSTSQHLSVQQELEREMYELQQDDRDLFFNLQSPQRSLRSTRSSSNRRTTRTSDASRLQVGDNRTYYVASDDDNLDYNNLDDFLQPDTYSDDETPTSSSRQTKRFKYSLRKKR